MQHTTTVRRSFEAGHTVQGLSACNWPNHGHRWEIAVTVTGGLDPKTIQVSDPDALYLALDTIVDELAGRNLNVMLPGVIPTPEGVGLYVRERLILQWPKIVRVDVSMGDKVTVGLISEVR